MAEGGIGAKLSNLPKGAWIVVVGGALAIAYFMNKQSSSGSAGPAGLTTESGTGGLSPGFIQTPPPTSTGPIGPLDNEAWAVLAVGFLVGNGYGAIEAGSAVRKYLDAVPTTSREKTLINLVTRKAPDGIGPPPNIPTPGGDIADVPKPDPNSGPFYTTVKAGWVVDAWIHDVQAGKAGIPGTDFSYIKLVALNPGVVTNIDWKSGTTGHTWDNRFKQEAVYRIR